MSGASTASAPVTLDEERHALAAERSGRTVVFAENLRNAQQASIMAPGDRMKATVTVTVLREDALRRLESAGFPVVVESPHGGDRVDPGMWLIARDTNMYAGTTRVLTPILENSEEGWRTLSEAVNAVTGRKRLFGARPQTRFAVEIGQHRDAPELNVGDTVDWGRVTQMDFVDSGAGVVVLATSDRQAPFLVCHADASAGKPSFSQPEVFTDWVLAASRASLLFREVKTSTESTLPQ